MPKRIRGPGSRDPHFIREWREYRNLTQDQLAARLDMSKASLSRIETGKQPYMQDFLEACAVALLTEPASLLMRNPKDPEAIWTIWDKAKPGERKKILSAAKSVLRNSARRRR